MPEGTSTFKGLAVPLQGEHEIEQLTAATDIQTLTGAGSMTGDFLVLQNSSGTELLYIDCNGKITTTCDIDMADGDNLIFGTSDDVSISWDGTDLDITGAAGSQIIKFGTAGTGFDMWFYGSQAGARMIWDEGKGQLLLNASAAVHTRLNMGVSSVAPTSTIAQGDLFMRRTGTTFRLGIASTGTTKVYTRKFDLTFGDTT